MANWSNSWITFSGEETNIEKTMELYKDMGEKEEKTKLGQMAGFIKTKNIEGYLHNIIADSDNIVTFDCKHYPPLKNLKEIAKRMKVSFEISYEELGNLIYSFAKYDHKTEILETYHLDDNDFEKYQETNEGIYIYNGEEYESEYDVLDAIFENKFGFQH